MKKNLLIAAVMLFALSTVAMAQSGARFTVASVPETFVSCCGQTEKTGDIGFTAVPGSPNSVAGTITVTYAVPVKNAKSTSTLAGISVSSAAQTYAGAVGVAPTVSIPDGKAGVDNIDGKGVVVITVGAGGVYPYSITLTGVRVDVSTGAQCGGSVSANITSTGNLLTSGETSVVVISNVKQALTTPTVTAVTVNAVTGGVTGTLGIKVKENFLDAFGKAVDPSTNVSKIIRLAITKVPAGVKLTFPLATNNALFVLSSASGSIATEPAVVTSSATDPAYVYYRLVTDSDPTVAESLDVTVGVSTTGATLPISGAPVSVSAHVGPIDNNIPQTLIPRYADSVDCETAKAQILSVFGASTTLLIPYAVNQDVLFGYNTGFAIANTTQDPGKDAMGFAEAVRQTGAITFYFFKSVAGTDGAATKFSYKTTAGSPGSGLNADGTLSPGKEYVVLLDQLLKAAGQGKDFTGNIFAICDFSNGHGQYFISDFEAFTNGALMLVVNNPDTTAGRAGPERLEN